MNRRALSVDTLKGLLGRGLDRIYFPDDWKREGNRGPGFDSTFSPDGAVKVSLYWTGKDGVIAAGDWDKVVYADGWDKASVIRAMCDNLTLWLDNILPDDAKGGD